MNSVSSYTYPSRCQGKRTSSRSNKIDDKCNSILLNVQSLQNFRKYSETCQYTESYYKTAAHRDRLSVLSISIIELVVLKNLQSQQGMDSDLKICEVRRKGVNDVYIIYSMKICFQFVFYTWFQNSSDLFQNASGFLVFLSCQSENVVYSIIYRRCGCLYKLGGVCGNASLSTSEAFETILLAFP